MRLNLFHQANKANGKQFRGLLQKVEIVLGFILAPFSFTKSYANC